MENWAKAAVLMLLFAGVSFPQVDTEHGNVTDMVFAESSNSTYWQGVYGDLDLGAGTNYSVAAGGNNVTMLDLLAQAPPCAYASISLHVMAVNGTALTPPLSAGSLPVLDSFTNGSRENGSATFGSLGGLTLSYGTYVNVPATYTYVNGTPSAYFRECYLNDAAGRLVFVADFSDNRPDWNGTISDYQLMLATNGSTVNYTIWADVTYTCAVTPPDGGDERHRLEVLPISDYYVSEGDTFEVPVYVENTGDFNENNVEVYFSCPSALSCGSGVIPGIHTRETGNMTLQITAESAGTYTVTAHARNLHDHAYYEFLVNVTAREEIPEPEKKPEGEECERDDECLSGRCDEVCVLCESDGDCADTQGCDPARRCEEVPCPCGEVRGHECSAYECCADADCGQYEFCIAHGCVDRELDILVIGGTMVEGDELLLMIMNNRGEAVPGAEVFGYGGRAFTDQNGYVKMGMPYDGIIYASHEGYPQKGELLPVIRKGFFRVQGEVAAGSEVSICLVDSRENAIAGATVFIGDEALVSDDNGCVRYTFGKTGTVQLRASREGYLIEEKEIRVSAVACGFPAALNLIWFDGSMTYLLWAFGIAGAAANFLSVHRRRLWSRTKSAAYSLAPLLLALPNVWPFSICVMANVVALQLAAELARMIAKAIAGEKEAQPPKEKGKPGKKA